MLQLNALYFADTVSTLTVLDKTEGRLFVRPFFAGRGPAYTRPQRWDLYIGPVCQPRERRGIGMCVQCMSPLCRVEEGLSRREQLVRYF